MLNQSEPGSGGGPGAGRPAAHCCQITLKIGILPHSNPCKTSKVDNVAAAWRELSGEGRRRPGCCGFRGAGPEIIMRIFEAYDARHACTAGDCSLKVSFEVSDPCTGQLNGSGFTCAVFWLGGVVCEKKILAAVRIFANRRGYSRKNVVIASIGWVQLCRPEGKRWIDEKQNLPFPQFTDLGPIGIWICKFGERTKNVPETNKKNRLKFKFKILISFHTKYLDLL